MLFLRPKVRVQACAQVSPCLEQEGNDGACLATLGSVESARRVALIDECGNELHVKTLQASEVACAELVDQELPMERLHNLHCLTYVSESLPSPSKPALDHCQVAENC